MQLNMIKCKSITNSMRHVYLINKHILCKDKSVRTLTVGGKNKAGRNNVGNITVFSKGRRSHNKRIRSIQFKSFNFNISGIIYRQEYDPNRSSFISLIVYKNKVCCYVLGVKNTNTGENITTYNTDISEELKHNKYFYKLGDSNQLCNFYVGAVVNNVEKYPNSGGIYIRSAGTYGKIIKKHKHLVLLLLPSNKLIYLSPLCYATLGVISNEEYIKQVIGKAGRNRWIGKKSIVRGVAMNPIDHPHGGGEGKKNVVLKKTPWGKIKKWNNKHIVYEE